MHGLELNCPACYHSTGAVGPRLHDTTLVRGARCGRVFAVTDAEVTAQFPSARYGEGKWLAAKVS
jgi:hypothetical protein